MSVVVQQCSLQLFRPACSAGARWSDLALMRDTFRCTWPACCSSSREHNQISKLICSELGFLARAGEMYLSVSVQAWIPHRTTSHWESQDPSHQTGQAPDPPSMRSNTQATICCSFVRTLQTLVEQSTTISDTRESFAFEPARLIASLVKNSLLYKSCFSMSRTTVPPGARPGRLQQRCHPLYCFARWTAKRWSMQPEMALQHT